MKSILFAILFSFMALCSSTNLIKKVTQQRENCFWGWYLKRGLVPIWRSAGLPYSTYDFWGFEPKKNGEWKVYNFENVKFEPKEGNTCFAYYQHPGKKDIIYEGKWKKYVFERKEEGKMGISLFSDNRAQYGCCNFFEIQPDIFYIQKLLKYYI